MDLCLFVTHACSASLVSLVQAAIDVNIATEPSLVSIILLMTGAEFTHHWLQLNVVCSKRIDI